MEKVKIFIELSNEIQEQLYARGLNAQTILEEQGFETGREEIQIKGEPTTRGILIYVLVAVGSAIVTKIAEKAGDKIIDAIVDKLIDPLLEEVGLGKKKEEKKEAKEVPQIINNVNITVNVLVQPRVVKANNEEEPLLIDEVEVLDLKPLSEIDIDSDDKVLIKVDNKDNDIEE